MFRSTISTPTAARAVGAFAVGVTVSSDGVVVFSFGPAPIDFLSNASALCGKDAILDTNVARMAGASFAMGSPAALAALKAKLGDGALTAEREGNPSLSPEATAWLAGGERGVSSNTIFEHLTGVDATRGWGRGSPRDPGDFRRCRLLLERVPELVPLFPRMVEVSPVWAALVAGWDSLCATMDAECPSWRSGRGGAAPKTYEIMRAIRKEAGDA